MRAWAVVLLLLTACGAASPQGALPLPSPPTAALEKWSDFPAHAKRRPVIAFGDTVEYVPPPGFPDGDRKIAWLCNRFVFAAGVEVSKVMPAWGGSDPVISSATAFEDLMRARSAQVGSNPQCTSARPFVITAVRWGTAGFPTDRGTMQMPAWLFDVAEVRAYIGHSAIDAVAYWLGRLSTEGRGASIGADGLTLKVPVGNPGPGPCESDYTAIAAESNSAVAIGIRAFPHTTPGLNVVCPAVLRVGCVSVGLKSPLDGRVLVDEKGDAGTVLSEGAARPGAGSATC